jgi:hypothetical protein
MRSAPPENLQDSQPDISHQLELGQHRQRAEVELNVTKSAGFRAKVDVSKRLAIDRRSRLQYSDFHGRSRSCRNP